MLLQNQHITEKEHGFSSELPGQRLRIVKVQRTCVHDGPGLRTTVFFRGCGLRCRWCQNPETLSLNCPSSAEDVGYSADDLVELVARDRLYYEGTEGGLTVSGGEPLLQNSDALVYLLKKVKELGIKVSAETTLHVPWKNIEAVLPYVDLFLVDFKYVGNTEEHKNCTGQNDTLILENLKKLTEVKANIRFRMVMVPGFNDTEENIKAAANLIKECGQSQIELLKYHNMYEDKAKRLNLDIELLNITPDAALVALKKGIELFSTQGISAYNTELLDAPAPAKFTDRVINVQKAIRESKRAICVEASLLKTKYYKKNKGFEKPTPIHRSERLKYVLENKKIKVYPDELIVGNFTSKRVAGQVWEEQYGVLYISFLYKVNRQKPVSFQCSFSERMAFYFKVFPFWLKNSLVRRAHPKLSDFIRTLSRISEMKAGFNNNFAAIAHYIPNYDRILELGTTGLIEEVKAKKAEKTENNQDFYTGVLTSLEALQTFGERYGAMIKELCIAEPDPRRKAELEKMAEVCSHVPKYPARTFHEAVQSIAFIQIALCLEAYENAISYGRLDQILYPYYKKDLDEGRITYDEAKELLCLFILKMDEVILINDGDSLLNIGKLFETLSTDQALTFGGVDKDGNDATNDLTYMLVDACELQPLAVNMTARIHKNSPQRYLDRLAEIYINGCPMPELFSDEIYIESIQRRYPDTSVENARNYSIVGCVEPIASNDHFGNTDCSNMNLALPLLQALKGHDHELWNFSKKEQYEKIFTKVIEFYFKRDNKLFNAIRKRREKTLHEREIERGYYIYSPPKDMNELLSRFQERLNKLARDVLTDHQNIEKVLRTHFTTPLASSMYRGCLERGLDAYEGGTDYNTSGIQAVGITDVADSFHAIEELVFNQKKYSLLDMIEAIDANFQGEKYKQIHDDILAVPKFGDDSSLKASEWVTRTMEMYNKALYSVPNPPRNGSYTAGYYALNVSDRYGKKTQALPSGRLAGVPLANSVTPHYGMEKSDLLSSLNALSEVNFTDFAANGTTVTFTIDSALFPGEGGVKNLSEIFRVFLTTGGMQFQPNVVSKKILLETYENPASHPYLMVRVAGYCAYFNELSDELKRIIINRTCYS